MTRAAAAVPLACLLLSACSGAGPAPAPLDAREVAYLRAVQAQATRIAAMTDEEVAAELARPGAAPPAARRARLESLEYWLGVLGCRERPSVARRGACYADAARLHEAAERLMRGEAAKAVVRT